MERCLISCILLDPFYSLHSRIHRFTCQNQIIEIPVLIAWCLFYFSSNVYHLYGALSLTGIAGGLMEASVNEQLIFHTNNFEHLRFHK